MVLLEDLIDELGGMGRYQIILTALVSSNLVAVGWSILVMSYAGSVPPFSCTRNASAMDHDLLLSNDTINACHINGTKCSSYSYSIAAPNVISEWDLVCDKAWIKGLMISVQMGGVFLGAVLAGQLGDSYGRKKVLYFSQAGHALTNLVAAFSNSWLMFAVCRFFIGIPIGSILVVTFPYPAEFTPIKWRPLPPILPAFSLGISLFALGTYLFGSWSHLHLACVVLCTVPLFGAFFVPESLRWLATQNRIDQALDILENIAKWNGTVLPKSSVCVLEQIAHQEKISREDNGRYTYIDIFKKWHSAKISLAMFFFWFTNSSSYYGITFGVSSLSGNIHVNIFLMAIVESVTTLFTIYFTNKYGRRISTVALYFISVLSTLACIFIALFSTGDLRGILINVFCLTARLTVSAAWAIVTAWGPELYPTVTRYLGFGFAQMGARIGGMVSPFIINFDANATAAYATMSAMFGLSILLCFFIPETKGKVLQDTFQRPDSSEKVQSPGDVQELKSLKRFAADKDVEGVNGNMADSEAKECSPVA